jgi:hypothetical protein
MGNNYHSKHAVSSISFAVKPNQLTRKRPDGTKITRHLPAPVRKQAQKGFWRPPDAASFA